MRTHTPVAALAAAAAFGGCSTGPLLIRGQDLGSPAAPARARTPGLPLVVIEPVTDARGTNNAGTVAGRIVRVDGLDAFVEAALATQTSPEFDAVRADELAATGEVPALRIRSRVLKAYAHSLSTSKSVVVVVESSFVAPDGTATVRAFRAQDVGANWASGDGEITSAVKDAAQSCAAQIRAEVPGLLPRP